MHGPFRQVAPRAQPASEPDDAYEPKTRDSTLDLPHVPTAGARRRAIVAPWKFTQARRRRHAGRAHRGPDVGGGREVIPREQGPAVLLNYWAYSGPFAVDAKDDSSDVSARGRPEEPAAQSRSMRAMVKSLDDGVGRVLKPSMKPASRIGPSSCSSPTTAAGRIPPGPPIPKASRTRRPRATCRSGAARRRSTTGARANPVSSSGRARSRRGASTTRSFRAPIFIPRCWPCAA